MVNSRQIRDLYKTKGYDLPIKGSNMNHHLFKFVDSIKEEYKCRIVDAKNAGVRFNITLDEWTSNQKRRFVNLNLHFINDKDAREFINLGMIYVKRAHCTAVYLRELIVARLSEFDLTEDDIIVSQSDGASVMYKRQAMN